MFGLGKKYINIYAPGTGKVVDLKEVPDPVFADKILGDGFAFIPESGEITAPTDGKISMIFETNHAFGMELSNGSELLVHIGVDTVELKGEGFKRIREVGEQVKAGEVIIEIDIEKIQELGKNTITPVIFTNPTKPVEFLYQDEVIARIKK